MESSASDKESVQDVSAQITDLQIVDDFQWVDNAMPEKTICSDNNYSKRIVTNIAQYEANVNNRVELPQPEYNEDSNSTRLVLDKQVIIEQQYWDQRATIINKVRGKPKLQNSHRKTVKDCNIISNHKTIPRHPSYYKFDDVTTRLLETLPLKMGPYKMGPYMNIVAKGHDSVVIYADCLISGRIYYSEGFAVKVYKMGSDFKKNCAILKLVQKEERHLQCIMEASKWNFRSTPTCVYRVRNVIVMNFIGRGQETAPSVDDLPTELCQQIYENTVDMMYFWYNKADIVHGRLSTKNILYCSWYLGWSHSVRRWHPQALTKLMKDCHFVTNYFASRGVTVKPQDELFKEITGLDKISNKLLDVPHKKDLWKNKHLTNPNRNCDNNALSPGRHRFK